MEAVKRIDKEIRSILKRKKQKDVIQKEVGDIIERLNREIIQIKKDSKIGEPAEEVLDDIYGFVNKRKNKCRYLNC